MRVLTVCFVAMGVALGSQAAGCGAFGASGDEDENGRAPPSSSADASADQASVDADAAPSQRSFACGSDTCTGPGPCCIGEADAACMARCGNAETPIYCDDTADCAEQGFICCVTKTNTTLVASACSSAASCDSNAQQYRACDPAVTGECGAGKACVPVHQLFGFAFQEYAFFLCEQ